MLKRILHWHWRVVVTLLVLLLLPELMRRLFCAVDPLAACIVLLLVSGAAYLIRERRKGRKQRPKRREGTERKPVFPQGGGHR